MERLAAISPDCRGHHGVGLPVVPLWGRAGGKDRHGPHLVGPGGTGGGDLAAGVGHRRQRSPLGAGAGYHRGRPPGQLHVQPADPGGGGPVLPAGARAHRGAPRPFTGRLFQRGDAGGGAHGPDGPAAPDGTHVRPCGLEQPDLDSLLSGGHALRVSLPAAGAGGVPGGA